MERFLEDLSALVLGAASWNRMIHVERLPQGVSATIFDAQETEGAGSTGVGKSMVLAALGCPTTFHCALGRDEYAALIKAACEKRGIGMIVDDQDAPTPRHVNIMDRQGGRYSIFLSNGPVDPAIDEARLAPVIQSARTIFLSLSNSSKQILPLLRGTQAEILLDLHDYDGENPWYDDFIACADVLQLSDVGLENPEAVIATLLSGRARQVVLTKGAAGASIYTAEGRLDIPAWPAVMVDSNGAGDAFSVALWLGQRSGLGLSEAGKFAAAAAAFAIEDASLFPASVTVADIAARAAKA